MGFKKYIAEQFGKHPIRSGLVIGTIIGTATFGVVWKATFVPAKQIRYFNIERAQEEFNTKFNSLYLQFTQFADRDNNGYIDFAEQVDAWKRMGYEGPFFESRGASQFPNPTIKGLEKAVNSYKQE